jgi:hypothetical protein
MVDPKPSAGSQENKLRDGPCARQYEWLERCAEKKQAIYEKEKMQSCPSETDRLIKCIAQHPLYFQKS